MRNRRITLHSHSRSGFLLPAGGAGGCGLMWEVVVDINEFKVLRTRDLCQHLGLSSRTIERYRKRSDEDNPFPEPDYPASGNSGHGWLASKVIAWQKRESLRDKRKPMAHIHLPRDERGHFIRPASA